MENNKPLTASVYNGIYEEIIKGDLKSGDIITEKQVIARYGISRSPVREALICLCDENVLCSIPRAGYQVVSFSYSELKQLTEARLLLELYLLEKGFLTLTDEKVQQLGDACEQCTKNAEVNSFIQIWYDNIDFHLLLASFAENKFLSSMLRKLLRSCTRTSTEYYTNTTSEHYEPGLHVKVIDACARRDLEAAKQFLTRDINQLLVVQMG